MEQLLQFLNFSDFETFFWKLVKSQVIEFKVICSIGSPCETSSFTNKMAVLIFVEIFMFFTCSENYIFSSKFYFNKNQARVMGGINIESKLMLSVISTISKRAN